MQLVKRAKFFYHEGYRQTHCRIDILQDEDDNNVVIFTELNANEGASVTNSIEDIVNTFLDTQPKENEDRYFGKDNTTFIERYENQPNELDEVTFAWHLNQATDPRWRRMNKDEATNILNAIIVE